MTVHIIRLAVGVESIENLADIQKRRLREARAALGRKAKLKTLTRNKPRRIEEVAEAGSLYWVVKGIIRVRQRILGAEDAVNHDGKPRCALILDPKLVPTVPRAKRAFQGWRYLPAEDAPPDLTAAGAAGLKSKGGKAPPAELLAELKELGLL